MKAVLYIFVIFCLLLPNINLRASAGDFMKRYKVFKDSSKTKASYKISPKFDGGKSKDNQKNVYRKNNYSPPSSKKRVFHFKNFTIYRDGIKIGESLTKNFVDENIKPNKTYCYLVTAVYEDEEGRLKESSAAVQYFSSYFTMPFKDNFQTTEISNNWVNIPYRNSNNTWEIAKENKNYMIKASSNFHRRDSLKPAKPYIPMNKETLLTKDSLMISTPYILINEKPLPRLSLDYKMEGKGYLEFVIRFQLENKNWQDLQKIISYQNTDWQVLDINLEKFVGKKVKFGFKAILNEKSCLFWDNINFYNKQ